MRSQGQKIAPDFSKIKLEVFYVLENSFGIFGDLHSTESHHDRAQIGIEYIWRHGYNTLFFGIIEQILISEIMADNFVINIFRGNIHEGKIRCTFTGQDIFLGNGVNMLFDIAIELLLVNLLLRLIFRFDYFSKIFQRKFGVYRY